MAKYHYCFLERFNNYFNRKLIRKEALEDYEDASENYFIPMDSKPQPLPFDFNPNDNITTEIICNDVPFDPDYFLLFDEEEEIISRWFILEQKRNRQGQWVYYLRRDVLADSYNELEDAPMYVEKGIISDVSSPLLMNNEGLVVNRIKKEEILLKDKTECAWLVLYLKKGILGENRQVTIDVPNDNVFIYEELSTPITSWTYYTYTSNNYNVINNYLLYLFSYDPLAPSQSSHGVKTTVSSNGPVSVMGGQPTSNTGLTFAGAGALQDLLTPAFSTELTAIKNLLNTEFNYKNLSSILDYNDKIIKDSQGKYFRVTIQQNATGSQTYNITTADSPLTKAKLNNIWNSATSQSQTATNNAFKTKINYSTYRIVLEELKNVNTVVDFSEYTGEGTKDSMLFDAICMPYGTLTEYIGFEVSEEVTTNKDRSLKAMNSLATQLTDQYVIDFQLLPYCPCPDLVNPYYDLHSKIAILDDAIYGLTVFGKSGGAVTDVFLVCPSASFTFDIEQQIKISDSSNVPDTYKIKYQNDCTLIRLCSPNYNGLFEMSLAKNGGVIEKFNVDVTLRPFNPYIHVNPDFSFLYGQDFNDVRGLICGGDFSLGIINDAWNVYEIQNKNYQAIFDRQIQNLDVNNAINKQEAGWGAIAGTVQGAGSGAIAGGMVGGPYGAIAGAVVGGVTSGVGGVLDLLNLEKRQQETRNYAIDNYNLQLGNIQALPYSITKTSALTFNNKLFPFIEIYECSEVEKEAYYLKLKYNGMTVSKIDYMKYYTSDDNDNYFRAKLIRIETISEDNHYVEAINEELMKGVFI